MTGPAISGATTAPKELDEEIQPLAVIRSRDPVRSATAFIAAAGKMPCPAPNSTRITTSAANDQAVPVSAVNTDQISIAHSRIRLDPNRSASSPPGIWHAA